MWAGTGERGTVSGARPRGLGTKKRRVHRGSGAEAGVALEDESKGTAERGRGHRGVSQGRGLGKAADVEEGGCEYRLLKRGRRFKKS